MISSDETSTPIPIKMRETTTDALRYWEPRRSLYNAVLATVVVGNFAMYSPASREIITARSLVGLFVLAISANACYCTAYIVDLYVQFSAFRPLWLRWRWLLLALGIAFAGVLAHAMVTSSLQTFAVVQQMED